MKTLVEYIEQQVETWKTHPGCYNIAFVNDVLSLADLHFLAMCDFAAEKISKERYLSVRIPYSNKELTTKLFEKISSALPAKSSGVKEIGSEQFKYVFLAKYCSSHL